MRKQLLQYVWKQILPELKKNSHFTGGVSRSCWSSTYRRYASYEAPNLKSVSSNNFSGQLSVYKRHIEVNDNSWPENLSFSYIWLRDHCRCQKCYNHTTNQRNLDLLDISQNIQPRSCRINDEKLVITWADGHESEYMLDWLKKNTFNRFITARTYESKLWDKNSREINKIAQIEINHYLSSEKGVYDVVKSLMDYGVGIITNVPATIEATEKVVKQISHVQHTMFGGMWELSNHYSHYDTAYTRQALGAHNDTTYFTEASGLQVFHCLHHEGEGGETLLVDGFQAANDLKETHPESYTRLASLPIESEYIEPGRHYFSIEPVLKLHPVTKQLQQIRFNLYDRAPMITLPDNESLQLYEDLRILGTKIRNPNGEWWLKLNPGMVLIINNWRVLHGRAAYTGLRKMTGCYIGRADFLSKAKVLGII